MAKTKEGTTETAVMTQDTQNQVENTLPKARTRRQLKPTSTRLGRANANRITGIVPDTHYKVHPIEHYLPIFDAIAGGSTATKAIKSKANPYGITRKDFFLAVNDKSKRGVQELSDLYDAALLARSDAKIEESIDIAEDDSKDIIYYEDERGIRKPVINSNATKRAALRITQAQWVAARANRRRYADKQEVEVQVTIRAALQQALERVGMTYDAEP